MPRGIVVVLMLVAAAGLCGCRATEATASAQANRPDWTTGFWFWQGSSADVHASAAVDVLYAQVGTIYRGLPGDRLAWGVGLDSNVSNLPRARASTGSSSDRTLPAYPMQRSPKIWRNS